MTAPLFARPHTRAMDPAQRRLGLGLVLALVAVLVALVIAAVARRFDRFTIERARPVVSRVDGLSYRVHEGYGHAAPDRAADTLATINGRVVDVLRHLRRRYPGGGGPRRAAVVRLLARYNPDNLAENSPRDPSGDTAYSMNKGALVALCLRERDPAASGDPLVYDIHDLDTLTFVALHEVTHIAIDAIDHPAEFWATFRFLLEEAEAAGVYVSPDFARAPRVYCGVRIDYNPRYDSGVRPIA